MIQDFLYDLCFFNGSNDFDFSPESVGYRTLVVDNKGQKVELLQMALKLYNPLIIWNNCEFSVQIDANNDGVADQELAGANRGNTEGLGAGIWLASYLMRIKPKVSENNTKPN